MSLRSMRRGSRLPIWLLLVALLAPPASAGVGRFVCVRGMAEAGASCPMCHGERAATRNPCCKWVERNATVNDAAVGSAIASPSSAPAALAPAAPATHAPALAAVPMRAGTLPPRISPSRSTILRL